jgi:GR25 family glycosyltransferase involved in LPS biosynthesis
MSYINTLVDKVYVINLDKDRDRLQAIDTVLRKQGISYERLPATLGSKVSKDSRLTTLCNMFCTDGIKGCAISHHRAWEDALQNGYSRILVFEDDAVIPEDFDKKVREVMYNLPDSYEIVFLGCRFFCSNKTSAEHIGHAVMGTAPQPFKETIQKVNGSIGAHATIYTSSFMKKVIDEPIETHIDLQIQRWITKFKINAYGLSPELVTTTDPALSSNLADKFPPLLNKTLDKFEVTDNVPLGWALSENQMKLGPLNINFYNLIFLALAAVLPPWISLGLFAWIGIETGVSNDIKNGLRLALFTTVGLLLRLGLEVLREGLRSL